MKKIVVVGSINMDLMIEMDEIPKIGETILGNSILQTPGGKGANQAVAIAKLGGNVTFLGKVGDDSFGKTLLHSMTEAGVDTNHIEKVAGSTGIAVINVNKIGENNIVVVPGANWEVNSDYLRRKLPVFKEADIVLFQLEIPMEAIKEGLRVSKELDKITVLNPAPAFELEKDIVENIDILIPNEHELARIVNLEIVDEESLIRAAKRLLRMGIKKIIVTLGDEGVLYADENRIKRFVSNKVNVVDTTGAGDSFIGGFVSSYAVDGKIDNAIDVGQKTASITIQKFGAQGSLPTKTELKNL